MEGEPPTKEGELPSQAANLKVRFGFRDSAHTWARVIATNYGPADARDVELEVWGERDGRGRIPVVPIRGEDYSKAAVLQPNESIHIGIAFTFGSPSPEDLRYHVSWVDDRGIQQSKVGRAQLE